MGLGAEGALKASALSKQNQGAVRGYLGFNKLAKLKRQELHDTLQNREKRRR